MNNIVKYNTEHGDIELSNDIVKKYLVSGGGNVSETEMVMFINLCKFQRLNPFLKEAYLVKFGSSPATMIVGKEVFTKRASKIAECEGWESGVTILNADKKLDRRTGTLVLENENLVGGWCKVYRKGWKVPIECEVSMKEFDKKQSSWKSMPATMIRKVAIVSALRDAFPEDFQGLYDSSEMPISEIPIENKIEKAVEIPIIETKTEINEDVVNKIMDAKDRNELTNLFKSIPKDQQSLYLEIFEGRAKEIDAKPKNNAVNEPVNDTAKNIMTKEELKLVFSDEGKLNLDTKKIKAKINKLKENYPASYGDLLDEFNTTELELNHRNYEYLKEFLTRLEEVI